MRIGLYDPYLDTLGGGERYILTAASCLGKKHDVVIFWDDESVLSKAQTKFNVDLAKVTTTKNIFSPTTSLPQKLLQTKKYDAIIYLSDGSIPYLLSKNNILLFQFPVNWVKGKSFLNKTKLANVDKIICYTNFVKYYLDKTFSKPSEIVYPPVEQLHSEGIKKRKYHFDCGKIYQRNECKETRGAY